MTDNKLDKLFEIQLDGTLIRTIDLAGLANPVISSTADVEGITWIPGTTSFALVLQGTQEMAIVQITPDTTALTRSNASIYAFNHGPRGIAYKPSEQAFYWVNKNAPQHIVKDRINHATGQLETIWDKTVDNLGVDLADIAIFPRLSPNLFLLSESSQTIMEVDMSGDTAVIVSSFSLASWSIPRGGGLTFTQDGNMIVVGKHAAGVPQTDFNVFAPTAPIPNLPPIVQAFVPPFVAIDASNQAQVAVDATASIDPDGYPITRYLWTDGSFTLYDGINSSVPLTLYGMCIHYLWLTVFSTDWNGIIQSGVANFTVNLSPSGEVPVTYPQPSGIPSVSLNYVHPGSSIQHVEFFFELHETGFGEIWIYDQSGKEVEKLTSPTFPPGQYRYPWDLKNKDGNQITSGAYFVVIKTPDAVKKEKMVVVR